MDTLHEDLHAFRRTSSGKPLVTCQIFIGAENISDTNCREK